MVARLHAHGCTQCHRRYEDVCNTPKVDAVCRYCQVGVAERPPWEVHRDPATCCLTQSVLVTDAPTKKHYALAGDVSWYKCRACHRTHPFNPGGWNV